MLSTKVPDEFTTFAAGDMPKKLLLKESGQHLQQWINLTDRLLYLAVALWALAISAAVRYPAFRILIRGEFMISVVDLMPSNRNLSIQPPPSPPAIILL